MLYCLATARRLPPGIQPICSSVEYTKLVSKTHRSPSVGMRFRRLSSSVTTRRLDQPDTVDSDHPPPRNDVLRAVSPVCGECTRPVQITSVRRRGLARLVVTKRSDRHHRNFRHASGRSGTTPPTHQLFLSDDGEDGDDDRYHARPRHCVTLITPPLRF